MPRTYEPIASTTLGSATTTVSFTNLPSGFTDLIVNVSNARHSFVDGGGISDIGLRFNGDSGNNYSSTDVQGSGASVASGRVTNTNGIFVFWAGSTASLGMWTAQIMGYSNSNVFKTTLTSAAIASGRVGRLVGLWRNTAAITSLDVTVSSGYTISSGAVISLYGIKAA